MHFLLIRSRTINGDVAFYQVAKFNSGLLVPKERTAHAYKVWHTLTSDHHCQPNYFSPNSKLGRMLMLLLVKLVLVLFLHTVPPWRKLEVGSGKNQTQYLFGYKATLHWQAYQPTNFALLGTDANNKKHVLWIQFDGKKLARCFVQKITLGYHALSLGLLLYRSISKSLWLFSGCSSTKILLKNLNGIIKLLCNSECLKFKSLNAFIIRSFRKIV